MKDLDPGRSGRENYDPETEGKPADRSTDSNPGGMQGSQSDRDRTRAQKGSQSDRDRNRGQKGSQSDRDRKEGMEGSPPPGRGHDKEMGGSQGERARGGSMDEPYRGPTDPSRAGSRDPQDELNDEDTAGGSGAPDRKSGRDFDTDQDRNR